MTKDVAPYSEAITEASKTIGKALDIARDSARPIGSFYALIIGDQVDAWRERNLDALTRRTQEILRQRNLAEVAPVAEQIAIPILEAAQGDPRPEMQELWATLLANAMDPSRRDDVREQFIIALKQFHPIDAVVLKCISDNWPAGHVLFPTIQAKLAELEVIVRAETVAVSLRDLDFRSCVDMRPNAAAITPFGRELVRACTP
jgi:hypothetical protein